MLYVSICNIPPSIMSTLAVILLFSLIYYHAQVNSYVCPDCDIKFLIGFFKDMVTFNGGKKGKYLKCTYCGHKRWFK